MFVTGLANEADVSKLPIPPLSAHYYIRVVSVEEALVRNIIFLHLISEIIRFNSIFLLGSNRIVQLFLLKAYGASLSHVNE
jgi:hypothetical protein